MNWKVLLNLFMVVVNADTECPMITSTCDRRYDKSNLRLVQYNVEWLFIDYYSPMDCPGNGCTWKNDSDAEIHMNNVAQVIETLNPDIINFCEVEGCDELNMLKDKINDETYTAYLKKGTDTSTGQNVGMMTRIDPSIDLYRNEMKYNYPIPNSLCGYTGKSGSSGVSKHYITEFLINELNIAFISAHLLAIPTDPTRCAEREAQASVLQHIIYEYIKKDFEIIMLGDFNDFDNKVMDINNNYPVSKVLDILKGYDGELSGLYTLYNAAENINQTDRYSDWWDSDNNCKTSSQNDYSMIDHILVTHNLREKINDVFIYHGYDEYCGKYNSDHYPVVIDFDI